MDAKAIVREMIGNGQSKAEIITNLQELGISEPEQYYEDAMRGEGKGVLSSGLGEKNNEAEREAKDILESETKPLFGGGSGNSMFTPKPTDEEKKRADRAVEDIPELEVTSISADGEKVKNIGEMLGKNSDREVIMRKMPNTSFRNIDEVERKLDELNAMLKAVYEIDMKILEANRDMLLRLKTRE
ncbi:MAG: hypothetical protein V1835_02240 [Candidatus Micrarchaeota archaeon]